MIKSHMGSMSQRTSILLFFVLSAFWMLIGFLELFGWFANSKTNTLLFTKTKYAKHFYFLCNLLLCYFDFARKKRLPSGCAPQLVAFRSQFHSNDLF